MTRAASVLTVALVGFLAGALGYLAGGGFRLDAPAAPPGFGATPPSFADVVARVNPAVVHVDVIVHDDDHLCKRHLPGAPDTVHDSSSLVRIGLADLHERTVVKRAEHRQMIVHDVRHDDLQQR